MSRPNIFGNSHTRPHIHTHRSHTRTTFAADVILFFALLFSAHSSTLCPLSVALSLAPCPRVPGNWVPGNCLGELSMNYVVLLRGPEFENLLKYARHCSGTTTGTGCGSCTGSGIGSGTCRGGTRPEQCCSNGQHFCATTNLCPFKLNWKLESQSIAHNAIWPALRSFSSFW